MLVAEQQEKTLSRPPGAVRCGNLILEFAARQRLRRYQPRQIVLHQHDCTNHVMIVLDGWAELVAQTAEGRRQIVYLALAGDLCAANLCSRARMDHAVTAITPLTVSITSKSEFRTLLTSHPRLALCFWKSQLLALSIQRRWTANLGQMGAMERIAHLMCEISLRQERLGLADGRACSFPLTQTQIADACGLTQVHTNRVIQELRRRHFIELRSKRLTIKSPYELEELAQFDPGYLNVAEDEVPLFECG
jgi:CRP-like cAMP-binding protein